MFTEFNNRECLSVQINVMIMMYSCMPRQDCLLTVMRIHRVCERPSETVPYCVHIRIAIMMERSISYYPHTAARDPVS